MNRLQGVSGSVAALAALTLAGCAADSTVTPGARLGELEGSVGRQVVDTAAAGSAASPAATPSAAGQAAQGLSADAAYSLLNGGIQQYVAFGDSFVSGVGASDVTRSPCGTSPRAWPYAVQQALGIPNLTFAACSDATTEDVTAAGGLKMPAQTSQLPAAAALNSALITIAIGINDIKLDERLQRCFSTASGSTKSTAPSSLPAGCGDLQHVLDNIPAVVGEALPLRLDYTFKALRSAAPNATIVAVGYPHLIDANSTACDKTATGALFSKGNRSKLNQLVDAINSRIQVAAAGAGIVAITDEIVAAFAGHEACSADEWIVSADALLKSGNVGVGHPNDVGWQVYGQAILSALSKGSSQSRVVTGDVPTQPGASTPPPASTTPATTPPATLPPSTPAGSAPPASSTPPSKPAAPSTPSTPPSKPATPSTPSIPPRTGATPSTPTTPPGKSATPRTTPRSGAAGSGSDSESDSDSKDEADKKADKKTGEKADKKEGEDTEPSDTDTESEKETSEPGTSDAGTKAEPRASESEPETETDPGPAEQTSAEPETQPETQPTDGEQPPSEEPQYPY